MKAFLIKHLEPMILALLVVFSPIKGMIATVLVIVIVDLITGILAARKRGEGFRSAACRRSVSKFIIYNTAILTAHLIETFLTLDLLPITKIVASIIGITECYSIFENLNSMSDNKLFTGLLKTLGSVNDDLTKKKDK